MNKKLTSLERTITTLSHKEPDRVPLFLLLSMYGAKELNMTVEEYFSDYNNVVEAQIRMKKKYDNDCYYAFYYASIEIEAMGGETHFSIDGPPIADGHIIKSNQDIIDFNVPDIINSKPLKKVLTTIELLKKTDDSTPIIGVVMSPFSIPVMQMGFDNYLDLMYDNEELFDMLMKKNETFCIDWANEQLKAGATAICYFDPVSSPTIIPKEKYLETGFKIAKRVIKRINGPTATHFASGVTVPVIDELVKTGTFAIGASADDDLKKLKELTKGKLTILGTLNGIEMVSWSEKQVENNIKELVYNCAKGGGLIISDNHGEIPLQVPEVVLKQISKYVNKWGTYPIIFEED